LFLSWGVREGLSQLTAERFKIAIMHLALHGLQIRKWERLPHSNSFELFRRNTAGHGVRLLFQVWTQQLDVNQF